MIDKGIVQGSEAQAKPLVVGLDTVYVHTDIRQITTEDGGVLYEYHEVQYTKDEYFDILAKQAEATDIRVDEVSNSVDETNATVDMLLTDVTPDMMGTLEENKATIDMILTEILPMLMGDE